MHMRLNVVALRAAERRAPVFEIPPEEDTSRENVEGEGFCELKRSRKEGNSKAKIKRSAKDA